MNGIALLLGVVSAVAVGALNAFINVWTDGYDVTSLVFLAVLPAGAVLLGMGAGLGAGLGANLTNSVLDYRTSFLLIGTLSGALAYLVYLFALYQLLAPGAPVSAPFEFATALFRERTLQTRSSKIDMGDVGVWVGYGSFLAAALGGLSGALIGDETRRKFVAATPLVPAPVAGQTHPSVMSSASISALPPAIDIAVAILAAVARAQTAPNYMTRDFARIAVAGKYELWLGRNDSRQAAIKSLAEARSREFFEGGANDAQSLETALNQFPKQEKTAATTVVLNCMVIAMTDGPLKSDEQALIRRIANGLGVDITKPGSSFDTARELFEKHWTNNFETWAKYILHLFPAGGAEQVIEHNTDAYSQVMEAARSTAYAFPWGDAAIAFASLVMSKVGAIMPEADRLKLLDQLKTAKMSDLSAIGAALENGKDVSSTLASMPDGYTMGTLFFGSALARAFSLVNAGIADADSFVRIRERLVADLGGEPVQQESADAHSDFTDQLDQSEWDEEDLWDDDDLEQEENAADVAINEPAPISAEPSASELVFWQSVMGSTDPADFTAYLQQFPSGAFRQLALNKLAVLGTKFEGS